MAKKKAQSFECVEPIGDRVLVRKDEPKRETRGGIALDGESTITGRIVTISAVVENDEELPLRQYDKILSTRKMPFRWIWSMTISFSWSPLMMWWPCSDVKSQAD